jgi:hypothetical protein
MASVAMHRLVHDLHSGANRNGHHQDIAGLPDRLILFKEDPLVEPQLLVLPILIKTGLGQQYVLPSFGFGSHPPDAI